MKETFLKKVMEGAGIGRMKAEYLWQIGVRLPAEQHQGEPVAPWYYFADCADPDYSFLFHHESEALTQVADHGGEVVKLWNVPPHADPGEVERLREQIKEWQETSVHWMHKCDTLRVQLAERDALRAQLADLRGMLRMAWGSDDISAEDCRRIDAAISASADQSAPVERCATGYRCHECKAETQPLAPFKAYVVCDCGAKTAATAAQMVERDERAEFEAFFEEKAKTLPLLRGATTIRYAGGQYVNDWALFGNIVWQARAALERKS